ncbi:hypothetical protein VE01_00606 [Pseudogymnoascus verrucosus]|uniref:DUF3074 domain-containing protein n=1 Tax=Pseudogymnoascus verrucosus TaxID=342668 RepID=A0A2P2SY12_9PEZI|nr:uncharacterized protein VE01_00606 [Pseudogymnoascus verrucosus]OBU01749.1 hypothetical protein VE01_00606 [Pseudogymnoascus verrucosus]
MNTTTPSGPLLSLTPYPLAHLPPSPQTNSSSDYPDLPTPTPSAPSATSLLTSLLAEALSLLSSAAPRDGSRPSWTQQRKPRHYPNSTAPVHLSSSPHNGAHWVCRRSSHRDAAQRGTASWTEFEAAFKTEHTLHEQEFTPSVMGFERVAWWEEGVKDMSLEIPREQWKGVSLELLEIAHSLPKPLNPRSFPVLQGIAERVDVGVEGGEFVVVTVPVDVKWKVWAQAVPARYAAVERFQRVGANVEWVMATASRAGGVLPGWAQDMSVPGVVAKDVDLYLKWEAEQRVRRAETETNVEESPENDGAD